MHHWARNGSGITLAVRQFVFQTQFSSGLFDLIQLGNCLFWVGTDLVQQFFISKTLLSPVVRNCLFGSQVADCYQ